MHCIIALLLSMDLFCLVIARREVITAFYIVFVGIVPAIALVSIFIYYIRRNPVTQKKPAMYVPDNLWKKRFGIDRKHAPLTLFCSMKSTPIRPAPPLPPIVEPIYAEIKEPVYDVVSSDELPAQQPINLQLVNSTTKLVITNPELEFTTNKQALKLLQSNK